ncbi:hypothetical protein ACFWPA_07075 [Rhodococcus sp. NPDC058505]|uniref:hypothetical protein n=1 Tax=unclassified Rhodococcus (in: high G+C Gram-positive bacteria) TaxID=192944 RepID=UPI00365E553D
MTGRVRAVAAGSAAVVAAVVAVLCWLRGVTSSTFGPVVDGAPEFTSTHYSGPWIGGATVAVIVAGLALLDLWRQRG